jgi:hypothetical protein
MKRKLAGRETLKAALDMALEEPKKSATDILLEVGLLYDRSKLILDETAIKLAGGFRKGIEYMERYKQGTSKYGERAWLIKGNKKDIIVFDAGNGWCQIIKEKVRK